MQSEMQNACVFVSLSPAAAYAAQFAEVADLALRARIAVRTARSLSESSEDFIVFERTEEEGEEEGEDFEEEEEEEEESDWEEEEEEEEGERMLAGEEERSKVPRIHSDEEPEQGRKKVKFNLVPEVHTMVQWDYAYRAARKGPWEMYARDRGRFKSRIQNSERALGPILNTQHRSHIWQQRFKEPLTED